MTPQKRTTGKRRSRGSTKSSQQEGLPERLDAAVKARGLSYTQLAKRIGGTWTPTRITEYRNGTKKPGASSIVKLSYELGVSADWLLFGEGSMLRGQSRDMQSLEQDFVAHVRRAIIDRLRMAEQSAIHERDMSINFDRLVASVVDRAAHQIMTAVERISDTALKYRRKIELISAGATAEQERISSALGVAAERQWIVDVTPLLQKEAEFQFESLFREFFDDVSSPVVLTREAVVRIVDATSIGAYLEDRTSGGRRARRSPWAGVLLRGNPKFATME